MLLDTLPKHSEFTYGVNRSVATAVINNNAFTLATPDAFHEAFAKLEEGVMGARRSLIAEKECLRQGIAYTLPYRVYVVDGKPRIKFMVYKRTKANADGGIVDKLSLGAGGHVETSDVELHTLSKDNDVVFTQAIDLKATMENSLTREVSEEVGCYDNQNVDIVEAVLGLSAMDVYQGIGFVMDGTSTKGYVGNIHFGAVYALEIPKEVIRVEMKEPQNILIGFYYAEEFPTLIEEGNEFEPWSNYILKQISEVETHILGTFYEAVNAHEPKEDNEEWESGVFNNVTSTETPKPTVEVKEIPVFNDPDSIRTTLEEIIRTEWKTLADKPYIPEIDFVRHLASNIKVNVVEQMEKVLQSFSVNCTINGEKTTVDATVGFNGKEYEFTMTFP